MIEAPKPEDEAERLLALKKLNILETPIEERFERITRIVCRTLGVPISAVSLVDEQRQWFKSIQGLDAAETPRKVAFCAHAILGDEALVVPNATEDPRFADNPLVTEDPNIRFYAGCPLILDNNVRIGTLCAIDREPRDLDEEQLGVLRDLADMVQAELSAVVLSEANQKLNLELQEAERAALIDPLTRLWNRGGGEQLLEREWAVAVREGAELAIMMLDIDRFKGINDTYGHAVGDRVIRHVGRTMLTVLRSYDVVARWGGEEFLIIMPRCGDKELQAAAERLLGVLRRNRPQLPDGELGVTASIGACVVTPVRDEALANTLERVDQALYAAKDGGRDCYVVAKPDQRRAVG